MQPHATKKLEYELIALARNLRHFKDLRPNLGLCDPEAKLSLLPLFWFREVDFQEVPQLISH